ncbi:hypothetical protein L5515_006802 [Caenorhabditis briggsae]|uniref:Uncharacterized protein n=1 Tax=Caenorhabditis briggsae TaxID=6238 RepID=A0AAE9F0A3_CAEBR|nr:hypothetical protein L5515_006802 [Caenorhabditis briggsae]
MVTLAQREKGIRSFAVRAQLLELGGSQLHWTHPSQRDAHRKSLNSGSPMNDIDNTCYHNLFKWLAGTTRIFTQGILYKVLGNVGTTSMQERVVDVKGSIWMYPILFHLFNFDLFQ